MGQHFGLVNGLHEECEARWISIETFDAATDWGSLMEGGRWRDFDGLIGVVNPLDAPRAAAWKALVRKKPGVLLTHTPIEATSHFVGVDGSAGCDALAGHFKAQGFHRVAFLSAVDSPWARERLAQFRRSMDRARIAIEDSWSGVGSPGAQTKVASGGLSRVEERQEGLRIFERLPIDRRPDALAMYSDAMASDFWGWAAGRGLKIPRDLSLTGWNDFPMEVPPFGRNVLTTLREDYGELARAAVRILDEILGARRKGAPVRFLLTPELIHRQSTPPILKGGKGGPAPAFLREVRGFLDRHFADPTKLRELPGLLEVSRPYFLIKFKKIFGRDFTDYLRGLRIRRASALLRSTDYSVASIQHEAGYTTHQAFLSAFYKETSMTPGAYRRQYLSEGGEATVEK